MCIRDSPGTVGSIRIRGNRSISASSDPLYVVDGVPLSAGGIETINPRDIESVSYTHLVDIGGWY